MAFYEARDIIATRININGSGAFQHAQDFDLEKGSIDSDYIFYGASDAIVLDFDHIRGNNALQGSRNLVVIAGEIGEIVNPVSGIIIAKTIDRIIIDDTASLGFINASETEAVDTDTDQDTSGATFNGLGLMFGLMDIMRDMSEADGLGEKVMAMIGGTLKFLFLIKGSSPGSSKPAGPCLFIYAKEVNEGGQYANILDNDQYEELRSTVMKKIYQKRTEHPVMKPLFTPPGTVSVTTGIIIKPTPAERMSGTAGF